MSHMVSRLADMSDRRKENLHDLETDLPYQGEGGDESSEDEVKFENIPVVEIHSPKDPRSKAKYNIFSRLLLW